MRNHLYLEGIVHDGFLHVSTASASALFVLTYCNTRLYDVIFINKDTTEKQSSIRLPINIVQNFDATFVNFEEVPTTIQQCALPSIRITQAINEKLLSGLSCVIRNIIKQADGEDRNLDLIKLLGHKEICLKACAEVSAWTKFCEVEMPAAVGNILKEVRSDSREPPSLPVELLRLENQFKQPIVVANIGKHRRQAKKLTTKSNLSSKSQQSEMDQKNSDDSLTDKSHNCDLQHNFVEGIDLTAADLVLFPLVMTILHHWRDYLDDLHRHLPLCLAWCSRLYGRPKISQAFHQCQFSQVSLPSGAVSHITKEASRVDIPDLDEKSLNIREAKPKKFKASSAEIAKSMEKLKEIVAIEVRQTNHNDNSLQLPWHDFPEFVHPKEGELPKERLVRKCQQLENLAQAVVCIAKPGQTVVDFCSGGGHLGILLAYLLPECKIVLVENKEESIERAERRIEKLKLANVTIYQCNLDYFHGAFDIGTCLHACGVATDLVLQCCLDNAASFVICPCCYGGIQNTHTVTYPRSVKLQRGGFTYKDYLLLGHGADQTQFNTPVAEKGKQCMTFIDNDRAFLAQEHGYKVTCTTLQPAECSPKNNLLVGIKQAD